MCVSSTNIDTLHFNDNDKLIIDSLIFIRPICDDSSGAEIICKGRACAKVSRYTFLYFDTLFIDRQVHYRLYE